MFTKRKCMIGKLQVYTLLATYYDYRGNAHCRENAGKLSANEKKLTVLDWHEIIGFELVE